MTPNDLPPSSSYGAGRRRSPVRTVAIGAAFVAVVIAIAWGYLGEGRGGREAAKPPALPLATKAAPGAPAPATPAATTGTGRTASADAAVSAAPGGAGAPAGSAATPPSTAAAPATPASGASEGDTRAATAAAAAPGAVPVMAPADAPRADASAVRGVIKPRDEVLFSAKIAARISKMPYREGERFQKGAVLVAFDCSRIRAEANAAWAANRASKQVLTQSLELDKFEAIGKSEVQIASAKSEQSAAEATALEAQMSDCTIVAPFSGIVVENISRQHENAAAGKELTRVLNDSELEMHLIVPSAWLAWLQPGSTFNFRVDETGRTHAGKVARLGAAVDPVSQTVRVVGLFTGGRESVLPGMSGSAEFAQNPMARAPAARAGDKS